MKKELAGSAWILDITSTFRTLVITLVITLVVLAAYVSWAAAGEVHVYPGGSIQAAIDSASAGDEVIVAPGTYGENITFMGKAITVRSTNPDDPNVVARTIIDGGQKGSVVVFDHSEGTGSILKGFECNQNQAAIFCCKFKELTPIGGRSLF